MKKKAWSMTCPASDLPKWIRLYTALRDRAHGAFRKFYEQDVADLLAAQNRLKERAVT